MQRFFFGLVYVSGWEHFFLYLGTDHYLSEVSGGGGGLKFRPSEEFFKLFYWKNLNMTPPPPPHTHCWKVKVNGDPPTGHMEIHMPPPLLFSRTPSPPPPPPDTFIMSGPLLYRRVQKLRHSSISSGTLPTVVILLRQFGVRHPLRCLSKSL